MKRYFTIIAFLVVLTSACKKDELFLPPDRANTPRPIADFIRNNYNLKVLQAAFTRLNLYDSLSNDNTYTLFVPDDVAFAVAGMNVKTITAMNLDSLRSLVRYHILNGRYYGSDFPVQRNFEYTTINGFPLFTSSEREENRDNHVFVDGVKLLDKPLRDIALSNGVIHFISQPLKYNTISTKAFLERDPQLSIFVAALKHFNMWDKLDTEGPLTVYAPLNEVFVRNGLTIENINQLVVDKYYPELMSFYAYDFKEELGLGLMPSKDLNHLKPNGDLVSLSVYNRTVPAVSIVNDNEGIYVGSEFEYIAGKDNNLTANGVVHKMNNLFFTPDVMLKVRN